MKAENCLIYCDMDGTMLTDWSRGPVLPKSNMDALQKFVKAGGAVSLATGRQVTDALEFFCDFEFNAPLVLGNGATICDPRTKALLWHAPLERRVVEWAVDTVGRWSDVWLVGADDEYLYVLRESEEKLSRLLDGVPRIELDKEQFLAMKAIKVCFACGSPSLMPNVEQIVRQSDIYDMITMVRSGDVFIEIVKKGVSKAQGVKRAQQLAGLCGRTLIGFGDYLNDYDMLRESDVAACPSNSAREVLDIADIICCSNNDGAFADLINKLESY